MALNNNHPFTHSKSKDGFNNNVGKRVPYPVSSTNIDSVVTFS
jgi:hypothetical protein